MAKKAAKSKKTAEKKAPSAKQLAARKRFAEMAKAKKTVAKRVVSVNAKPKSKAKSGSSLAKIPPLGVKPLSKPAYAETDYQTRGKREPVVKETKMRNWIGNEVSVWM